MPKLPGRGALGAREKLGTPGAPVAFRADIAQRAEAAGQRGLGDVIGGLDAEVSKFLDGEEKLKLSKARSDFLTGKIELDAAFKLDRGFEDSEERYSQALEELRAKTGGTLFGDSRTKFDDAAQIDIATGTAAVKTSAFGYRKDHNLAKLAGVYSSAKKNFQSAPDATTRNSIVDTVKLATDSAVEQGFLNKLNGEKMNREFVVESSITRVASQPPAEIHRLLQVNEGWSPGDDLPAWKVTGTTADFIPEDKRVELARKAMPGVNKVEAIKQAARIQEAGGSIEAQIEAAKKISNPIVQDDVVTRLKADHIFAEKQRDERLRAESQAEADNIRASGLSKTAMLDTARGIKDDDLRDATVKRVRARINEDLALDTETRRQLKRDAWKIVNETGSTENVTPEMRAEMDGNTLAAMDRYARTKQEGKEPIQDWDAWTEFTGQSPEKLAAMNASDYQTKYRNRLDDAHYDKGLSLLRREKGAEANLARKAVDNENKRRSYAEADRVARQIIFGKKLDKNKNTDTISNINNAMSIFVDRYVEKNEGRYPTRTEMIKFGAGLVLEGEIEGSGIFFDDDATRVDVLGTKNAASFRVDKDDLAGISAATGIAQTDLPAIIKVLEGAGKPLTLANIERAKEFIK